MNLPFELPPAMVDHIQRTEAAEAAEWEARQRDRAEAAWDVVQRAEYNDRLFEYVHGHTRSEWNLAMANIAVVRENRDSSAEYGSASRSAILVNGKELAPVERSQRGPWQANPEAEMLKRSRAVAADLFMAEEVRRFDQRQRDAGKPVISRSQQSPEHVECVECAAENLSEAESFEVHYNPRFGDPLPPTTVPDYPPSRSRRVRSGVGWPELVR